MLCSAESQLGQTQNKVWCYAFSGAYLTATKNEVYAMYCKKYTRYTFISNPVDWKKKRNESVRASQHPKMVGVAQPCHISWRQHRLHSHKISPREKNFATISFVPESARITQSFQFSTLAGVCNHFLFPTRWQGQFSPEMARVTQPFPFSPGWHRLESHLIFP